MKDSRDYQVTFLPGNRTVQVRSATSLIKAARLAGVHINASCGGSGLCGKCRVILEGGELAAGRSEKLSDEDVAHLQSVLADTQKIKGLVDARPDVQDLYTRAIALYQEITEKALQNEQHS